MRIVIDISKEKYNEIMSMDWVNCRRFFDEEIRAIHDGKVLPKGHGRIMDVDKILKKMEEREERLKDDRAMYETSCVETAIDMFGETIIKADRGE